MERIPWANSQLWKVYTSIKKCRDNLQNAEVNGEKSLGDLLKKNAEVLGEIPVIPLDYTRRKKDTNGGR
jgi:hypothetical protein